MLISPDIDAAIAQGIRVVTIDSGSLMSKRLFFIGTDNFEAGGIGAEAAARRMQNKSNVVVFAMPDQINLCDRLLAYPSDSLHPQGLCDRANSRRRRCL